MTSTVAGIRLNSAALRPIRGEAHAYFRSRGSECEMQYPSRMVHDGDEIPFRNVQIEVVQGCHVLSTCGSLTRRKSKAMDIIAPCVRSDDLSYKLLSGALRGPECIFVSA
jgi:hypothetical protein